MRPLGTLVATLCLAAAAAAAAGAPEGEQVRRPARNVLPRYHEPLEDSDAGRLYEPVARLLETARRLPERIELPEPELPPARQVEEEEPPDDLPLDELPDRQWAAVVDRPVVELEELAFVHFMAGRYADAARLYEHLHESDSGDRHVAVMLLLSLRNAGREEETRELLGQLRADATAAEWAAWMEQMREMGLPITEETQ